jgi:hypothetical protein
MHVSLSGPHVANHCFTRGCFILLVLRVESQNKVLITSVQSICVLILHSGVSSRLVFLSQKMDDCGCLNRTFTRYALKTNDSSRFGAHLCSSVASLCVDSQAHDATECAMPCWSTCILTSHPPSFFLVFAIEGLTSSRSAGHLCRSMALAFIGCLGH